MSAALACLALALVGQGIPPELRNNQPRNIDMTLPGVLRPTLEQASDAELDPKRGTGNAMEIIKAARERLTDAPLRLSLDLRMAALVIRTRFLNDPKVPPEQRAARALSTFSRLDLTEPGLGVWVKRAIASAAPDNRARLTTKEAKRIRVYLATQGAGIDASPFYAELGRVLETMDMKLVKAAPKEADFTGKLAALEVRDEGGSATVRVTLDLAATAGAEPRWRRTYYRTAIAPDAKVALEAGVTWLTRIGGRDLLFTWLDAHGLEGAVMVVPGQGDHDHAHDHGEVPERAPIVGEPPKSAPPRVKIGPGTPPAQRTP